MRRTLSVLSVAVLSTAIAGSALAATSSDLRSPGGRPAERAGNVVQGEATGRRPARAREGDRPEPRQRLGSGRRSDDAVVGERRGQRRLDAVRRHGRHHPAGGRCRPGGPTGLVYNGSTDFTVTDGSASGPSVFLFSTEGGTINGWNPAVPAPSPSTQSFVVADRTGEDANYKGLAIASTPDGEHAVRDRLPQRPGRHVRQRVQRREHRDHVRRSRHPRGVRAVRHPGDRRHDLRRRTPSRTPTRRTRCAAGAADTSTRSPPTGRSWAGWRAGITSTPRGDSRWRRRTSVGSAAPSSSATSATARSTRSAPRATAPTRRRASCGTATGGSCGRRPVGDRVRQRRRGRALSNALYFTAGPDDEAHGLFGRIRA